MTNLNSQHQTTNPFSLLHERLQRGIEQLGFSKPTPIQTSVISAGIEGRDLLACAQTGSGKTAAFLLPLLHRLLIQQEADRQQHGKPLRHTRALIIAPTRELAAQIKDHFSELACFTNLRGAAIFGGVSMGPQESAFRTGVDIMVATPGRLLDHFSNDYAKLDNLEYLILDEADRMLDMGFLPDIKRVMQNLPRKPRQTMLFSATLPEPIVKLAETLLNKPLAVNIERPPMTAEGIEHLAYPVPDVLKQHLLHHLLDEKSIQSAIVFTRTKHRANRLAEFLGERGISCETFHSNKRQTQRTLALKNFKNGTARLLIATDIAARGIDVEALSHVINFDVPHLPDDYIHRSGRTARANQQGISLSLVSPHEVYDFRRIENHIDQKIRRLTVEDFDYKARPEEKLEVPLGVRLAAHRARRSEERARSAAKAAKRSQPEQKKSEPAKKGKSFFSKFKKDSGRSGRPNRRPAKD
jgi:ATP-dependent RNA helicase RhlE